MKNSPSKGRVTPTLPEQLDEQIAPHDFVADFLDQGNPTNREIILSHLKKGESRRTAEDKEENKLYRNIYLKEAIESLPLHLKRFVELYINNNMSLDAVSALLYIKRNHASSLAFDAAQKLAHFLVFAYDSSFDMFVGFSFVQKQIGDNYQFTLNEILLFFGLEHIPDPLPPSASTKSDQLDYDVLVSLLETRLKDVKQQITSDLAPSLNAKIQSMLHDTYDQKKELAKWVNDELRRFDLAIKCPKTGQPSLLLVGTFRDADVGRFILEHKTSEGKRVRSVTFANLPDFELIEANPRREALLEWRDKVGHKPDKPKRG